MSVSFLGPAHQVDTGVHNVRVVTFWQKLHAKHPFYHASRYSQLCYSQVQLCVGYIYMYSACQSSFSLISNINQSSCSTLDWVLNSQSELIVVWFIRRLLHVIMPCRTSLLASFPYYIPVKRGLLASFWFKWNRDLYGGSLFHPNKKYPYMYWPWWPW